MYNRIFYSIILDSLEYGSTTDYLSYMHVVPVNSFFCEDGEHWPFILLAQLCDTCPAPPWNSRMLGSKGSSLCETVTACGDSIGGKAFAMTQKRKYDSC